MENVKYYQIESRLTLMSFKLEKLGNKYLLKVLEDNHFLYEQLFATKEQALLEILSYAETD